MRDEHVGERELVLEVLEQVDDLRLDRDVERGDGLVGDDQLRAERQRPGDPDPLPLPAGELVREAVVVLGAEADPLEQLLDAGASAPRRRRSRAGASGSPTICPTRLRGLSDAYGSWKIICICRRSGRSSRREAPRSPCPRTGPSPRSARAAAASSGTASTSRTRTHRRAPASRPPAASRSTPSTAAHLADLALDQDPRLDREVLDEPADLDQRLAVVRRRAHPPAAASPIRSPTWRRELF